MRTEDKEGFEEIYWPDKRCTFWSCGKLGIVLAYDDFSPEVAHWFCEDHWPEYEALFTVVVNNWEKRKPENFDHFFHCEQCKKYMLRTIEEEMR